MDMSILKMNISLANVCITLVASNIENTAIIDTIFVLMKISQIFRNYNEAYI